MTAGLRLDLHVHTIRSPDGRASLTSMLAAAGAAGLDGLAVTDHNTVPSEADLAEARAALPSLRVLAGVEVSTHDGHLLVYGVGSAPPPARPLDETIAWVRDHGGAAVLAHPSRRVHGAGAVWAERAEVTALETLNGHNGRAANRRAAVTAGARRLGATGGSDAHRPAEVGRAWTVFPAAVVADADLLEAIRRGATSADGRSASPTERLRTGFRSAALRLARGLRPL